MAKFQQIEINGQYQFQALNAAARKMAAKFGLGMISGSSMVLLISAAKGKIEFVK
jgi:hypothetical protein